MLQQCLHWKCPLQIPTPFLGGKYFLAIFWLALLLSFILSLVIVFEISSLSERMGVVNFWSFRRVSGFFSHPTASFSCSFLVTSLGMQQNAVYFRLGGHFGVLCSYFKSIKIWLISSIKISGACEEKEQRKEICIMLSCLGITVEYHCFIKKCLKIIYM